MNASPLSAVIVGAGFGGLAAAIELTRAGFRDITIFERGSGVGGVWRENHYPGAACDVPSVIYSFSFALKSNWSQPFGLQPEIQAYLDQIVDEFGLRPHLRLNTEVTSASYDEASATWTVEVAGGERVRCQVLIMATGQLSRPKMPDVEGLDQFDGASFHSAEWDHEVDLTGKRVAVVGSGASAIQIVPAIVNRVKELTVIQRSPNWVIRKSKRRHGRVMRTVLKNSATARSVHHNTMFLAYESRFPLVLRSAEPVRKASEAYYKLIMRHHLGREDARTATPDYTMLCNRLLLSNDWYPALGREHVTLVGSAVERVTANGLVCADGTAVEADVIVWCTGFKASEFLAPIEITGRGGVRLHDQWAGTADAFLGMSVPNFPNLVIQFGPNTNSITNTIVFLLERQARYARLLVEEVATYGGAYDLRPDVHAEFQAWLEAKLAGTVFTDSCPGWYTNAAGKVTAMWPSSHLEYARMTRQFDHTNYHHLSAGSGLS
jgi:cation diffusion facilitator CzcD-associated flavoprotein CzcO